MLILQTILLRDKQGEDYCVACKELTSDTDKDNPGMSTTSCYIVCTLGCS